MLMDKLAGLVVLAAIRSQPVDDVVLVEEIPYSRSKEIFFMSLMA